jgi:hypothetical protein
LPENSVSRHPPTGKIWQSAHFQLLAAYQLYTTGFLFPASHFWLFPQTVYALLKTTDGFDYYPSLQGESILYTIALEFIDDLKDDSVHNGYQSIKRSRVSAHQTAMT